MLGELLGELASTEGLRATPCLILQREPQLYLLLECSETRKFIQEFTGYSRTPLRFCALEQLLQLDVRVLGLPVPLLCSRLKVLRCLDVDLLVGLLVVQKQQLLGQGDPTRKKNFTLSLVI